MPPVELIARAYYNQRSVMNMGIQFRVPAAQRLSAFAISCVLHAAWLSLALSGARPPEGRKKAYTLTMLPRRAGDSIIWYSRPDKLPPVASGENALHPRLAEARPERKQTITSSPNAAQGKEFIWVPDSPAQHQNPPDLPNMLVLSPGKPAPRAFEAPKPTRAAQAEVAVPLPPELPVPPAHGTKLPLELGGAGTTPRRPLRVFEAPAMKPSAIPNIHIPPPPELHATRSAAGTGKLPPGLDGAAAPTARPLRKFEPSTERARPSVATSIVAEPPALTAPASDPSVTLAVVKLDGRQIGAVLPPLVSHEARIASGPAQVVESVGKLAGTPGAIAIPNLGVRGSSSGSVALPDNSTSERPASHVAPAATTAVPRLPYQATYQATSSVSAPQWPGARNVPAVVEEQFRGRVVFKTVLTSTSSQDWVLWFGVHESGDHESGDREAVPAGNRFFMRPPVALQAAGDPPVSLSPRQRVLLSGILTTEGRLAGLTTLAGPVTPALVSALGARGFTPAMRNGKAVEVSIVLEIIGLE